MGAERRESEKGFLPPALDAVSSAGRTFVSLVLDAFNDDRITTSDVSDFLGVGIQSAFSATLCTDAEIVWRDCPTVQRRRLNASSIAQLRQPPFDDRLLKRARLLPQNQREAMQALVRVRANWPHGKTVRNAD